MNTAPALIFVIEDELSIARLVQSVLVEFGFEVECFHTGASALRRLAVRRPDLCITDLGLPDMDGIDLVRQISQQCPCGLLILSGRGHTADRIMGLELGGDDYVTKPFEPRELVARVRSILRRRGQVPGGGQSESRRQACFLNWTLDCSANTLRADDGTPELPICIPGQAPFPPFCISGPRPSPFRNVYACYSLTSGATPDEEALAVSYLNDRICAQRDAAESCFPHPPRRCDARCDWDATTGSWRSCRGAVIGGQNTYRPVTTYLNAPCDLLNNPPMCAQLRALLQDGPSLPGAK